MMDAVPLLRAAPHQWGEGRVHCIDPDNDNTLCGQSPARCPGRKFYGPASQITCKLCLRSIEARTRAEAWRQEWQRREAERAELNRRWWAAYNAYLITQTWRHKRGLVLKRAAGRCEGCGRQRAVQVHHVSYPRDCLPGSPQWLAAEMLWTLKAICRDCHRNLHRH